MCFGFYGDDFGIHLPIGPRAGEHKVSLHYTIWYNLPKNIRFNIHNLLLTSVVFTADAKRYGPELIVSGSGNDSSLGGSMRRFADGVCLPRLNQLAMLSIDTIHYGALAIFFADSPYLHFFLGRKESLGPTTYRICHHCTAKNDNKHKCFSCEASDCPWQPIDRQLLAQQRRELQVAKACSAAEFARVSKNTGLNETRDAFEGCPWFDSTLNCYNDWFHGEPEGPLKDHTYLLIQHGIKEGYFSFRQFLRLCSQFPYYKDQALWRHIRCSKQDSSKKENHTRSWER